MKIRLLIATADSDYSDYLSGVLSAKYADTFDVSTCSNQQSLKNLMSMHKYDVGLLGEEFGDESGLSVIPLLFVLRDAEEEKQIEREGLADIKKYQRISSIVGEILGKYAHIASRGSDYGQNEAKVTVVWSPIGGAGKTTVALAYAAWRVSMGKKAVYLDMEPFSSVPVYFRQEGKSISAVLSSLDSNVELLIQSIWQQDSGSGITYFGIPENYDDMDILTESDVERLVSGCAKCADEIIVDTASVCDGKVKKLLNIADTVLIVLDGSQGGNEKWTQFKTQNNVFDSICQKTVLVANRGAALTDIQVEKTVSLPLIQSNNPTAVYKTLSGGYFGSGI